MERKAHLTARRILAIDAGTTESGYCFMDTETYKPLTFGKIGNDALLTLVREGCYDALEAADKRIAELERILKAVQENSGINFRLWQEAEAQLPKEGEWLRTDAFPHRVYCSCCYKTYVPNENWQIWQDDADNFGLPRNYCPNCGAKMQTVTDCHALEESER